MEVNAQVPMGHPWQKYIHTMLKTVVGMLCDTKSERETASVDLEHPTEGNSAEFGDENEGEGGFDLFGM
jgi:hypothetical protein